MLGSAMGLRPVSTRVAPRFVFFFFFFFFFFVVVVEVVGVAILSAGFSAGAGFAAAVVECSSCFCSGAGNAGAAALLSRSHQPTMRNFGLKVLYSFGIVVHSS